MCEFAGIFAYSNDGPPFQDAEFFRILDQMLHRGIQIWGLYEK